MHAVLQNNTEIARCLMDAKAKIEVKIKVRVLLYDRSSLLNVLYVYKIFELHLNLPLHKKDWYTYVAVYILNSMCITVRMETLYTKLMSPYGVLLNIK